MNVERILDDRRQTAAEKPAASWLWSAILHAAVVATVWFVPGLLAEPPKPIEYVPVSIFSPAILGAEEPPPPPPPEPEPEPPPPAPSPEPEPEPIEEDTMVLVEEEKKVEKLPPPPPRTAPPPPAAKPPPKRTGSPFGSTLGSSTSKARVGVEDPNFTYGYYLDRVVAVINGNWVRPPVGDVEQTVLYFRIQRDGSITELRLAEPSGSETFDRAAFRAVQSSSPLPPLPSGYKRPSLGINLIVK